MEIRSGRYKQFQKTYVGKVAGGVSKSTGYHQVNQGGKVMRVHRIIYEMIYGEVPKGLEVDHINGCRTDNRIANLRLVTPSQNMRNRKIQSNNGTGVTGVILETKVVDGRHYEYYVTLKPEGAAGKYKTYFSVAKLGAEIAFRLAQGLREKLITQANEQGAGYTDRHGKE